MYNVNVCVPERGGQGTVSAIALIVGSTVVAVT